MSLFKRSPPFSEQVYESLQDIASQMKAKLDEAKAGERLTGNVYLALSFVLDTARGLIFSFLGEKQSPLYRLKPADLPDPEAPLYAFVDLLTAILYQLRSEMAGNEELVAKVGKSHEELTTLFCEIIGLKYSDVSEMLQAVDKLEPGVEGSIIWDIWLAYFRESLTGRAEGISFDHKAWRSGYNDVVGFYRGIATTIVDENIGRLRIGVETSR
jgi:hypothetical protein